MIKSVELKNFKSIKSHRFPMRNLNVVAGLNGMGKSTFIQAALLLRQSRNLDLGELQLNGDYVKIGKSNDAFYQYSKDDKMVFAVSFDNDTDIRFNFAYVRETDTFKADKVESLPPSLIDQSLMGILFQYISANRIEPKEIHEKSYTSVLNQRNVGINGQYTAHFLSVFGTDDITFKNLKHEKAVNLLLSEQVNRWMGEISPGVRIITTEIPNSDYVLLNIRYEQPNLGFTNTYKPTNVGFGISYALPVVTALLAAKPGELIIIENPESHIHPKGQSALGKLIALTAMNDVQVVIETHSDHILNGIRVAVKEKDIDSDKVILFYFERSTQTSEQYSRVTNVEIDKNGELSEYPNDLLEEWSNQLIKLV